MNEYSTHQRRQSGLKSGGSWIRVKKIDFLEKFPIFLCNFTKHFVFQGKFLKNFDCFKIISQNMSIFHGKFPKNFSFLGNFPKIWFSIKLSEKFRFLEAI